MLLLTQTMKVLHNRNNSRRPYLPINVDGIDTAALYDTGADVSCLSEKAFRRIPVDRRPIKIQCAQNQFKAANGMGLDVKGKYMFNVKVQQKTVQHPFYVISNLSEESILGMDFIRNHKISFCPIREEFLWENHASWTMGQMRTAQREKIGPLTSTPIRVNLLTDGGGRPHRSDIVFATVNVDQRPSLMGGPGLVRPDQNGQAWIEVINSSPFEVTIDRGLSLGPCERIEENQLTLLDPVKINSVAEEECKNSVRKPPSNDKIKFIRENANVNVPDEYKEQYMKLLIEHHEVFSDTKYDLGRANTLMHDIELNDPSPAYVKQFKIPEAHQQEVEKHVLEWLKLGVIQPARSKFNSPLFIVAKKDGGVRIVQDFRALNAKSVIDKYSMKDINECIGEIGRAGSTLFSTLDLTSGFWQMVLHPKSRPYTAFTVPGLGQFQWVTSPMGLLGCPASFQRLVEAVVRGIRNIIVYIDDLLVHSQNHHEHLEQLDALFKRLKSHNLKANLKKCVFGSDNVSYLGFRLTPDGIKPGLDKLKVIEKASPPQNVHEVRQFLGLCNFFRTHVRNFAQITAPLTALTRKDTGWKGGEMPADGLQAFRELQSCLISGPVVEYPRADRPYALIVDAALGDENHPGGLGAILTQINEQKEHCVIAYASRKLSAHEKNYTPFLLEMQAAVWGIEHFGVYLRGRHFTLYTDHKPLEKLGKVHTRTLNRLQEIMNSYDFEIVYKKGSEMPADYLSRHALDSVSWDTSHLIEQQKADPVIELVRKFIMNRQLPENANEQRIVKFLGPDCFMENDVVWKRMKRGREPSRAVLLVPRTLVPQIIKEAHGQVMTGHDGIFKTRERILQCYYWIGMDKDIQEHLAACQRCQMRKAHHAPTPLLLTPLPQTSEPNQRVHADLFGPLRTSGTQKKYIMVITDAFTKYVELIALPNKEAETVATAFFNRWICRYGVPLEIVTDQGKEFVNLLSEELWKLLGTTHTTTTAHHPQCNAQAEVANKTIAKYLSGFVDESTLDWELYLAPLMFSYNTSFHKSIQTTPFFLTFGMLPRLPNFPAPDLDRKFYGESSSAELHQRLLYARDLARRTNEDSTDKMKEFHDRKGAPHSFRNGQWILMDEHSFLHKNTKLAPKFSGPHQIIRLKGENNVELQLKNGKRLIVNAGRLKPYTFPLPEVETTPENKNENYSRFKSKEEKRKTRVAKKDNEEPTDPIEEDPYLPDPVRPKIEETPEIEIKTEPLDIDDPVEVPVVVPPKAKRQYARRKVRWEYQVVNPEAPTPPVIPDDPAGGRVTRHKAKLLLHQNREIHAEESAILDAIKRHVKIRRKISKQTNDQNWNRQKRKNYNTYGDIFKTRPYKNYSTADSQPIQSDSDNNSTSADDSDSDITIGTDPEPEDPVDTPAVTDHDDTDVDESDSSSSTSSADSFYETPTAPVKYPDYPTGAFRLVGSEYPEYTGTVFPSKKRRTKHISPKGKDTAKRNLIGEFEEFVLGPRPSTSKETTLGARGKQPPTQRGTRSVGPAPPIGPLPSVPLERKPRQKRDAGPIKK